jgi:hypothetical protein
VGVRLGQTSSPTWTRTVELGREGIRAAVATGFKAAFEADSLENIVVFRGRKWLGVDQKAKGRLDPEWSA